MSGITPHILAIKPLLTATVNFRISGKTREDAVNGGARCRALVKQVNPSAENIGTGVKAGEQWVVRFIASELQSFNRIAIGSVIEADGANHAWPQLAVQKRPYVLNGICTLECSANETGRRA